MIPTFLSRLADPRIRRVMLCGCGGGFDFLHGLLLYPELKRLGKEVTFGSYSFGDPRDIGEPAPVVFGAGDDTVKRVTAASVGARHYAPEVQKPSENICLVSSYLLDRRASRLSPRCRVFCELSLTEPPASRASSGLRPSSL